MKKMDKKGVAGLNILLSVISMIFMIGIIVMVFVIAGSRLKTSMADIFISDTQSVVNESLTTNVTDTVPQDVALATERDFVGTAGVLWTLNKSNGVYLEVPVANYTMTSAGSIYLITPYDHYNNTEGLLSYTYTYTTEAVAQDVINDTSTSLGEVPDWFPTFIVLVALVVLILLVVIIINSIKQSGMTEGA